jgi:hypothetical protein
MTLSRPARGPDLRPGSSRFNNQRSICQIVGRASRARCRANPGCLNTHWNLMSCPEPHAAQRRPISADRFQSRRRKHAAASVARPWWRRWDPITPSLLGCSSGPVPRRFPRHTPAQPSPAALSCLPGAHPKCAPGRRSPGPPDFLRGIRP